jgi:hypothetical protein
MTSRRDVLKASVLLPMMDTRPIDGTLEDSWRARLHASR